MSRLSHAKSRPAAVITMLALILPSCEPSPKPPLRMPQAEVSGGSEGTWHTVSYRDVVKGSSTPRADTSHGSPGWNWSASPIISEEPSGGSGVAPTPLVVPSSAAKREGDLQAAMAKMDDEESKPQFTLRGGSNADAMRKEIEQQRRGIKELITGIEDRERAAAAAAGVPQPVIDSMPRSSTAHPGGDFTVPRGRGRNQESNVQSRGGVGSRVPKSTQNTVGAVSTSTADLRGDLATPSDTTEDQTVSAKNSALERALRPMIKPGVMALVRPEKGAMSCDDCAVLINGVNTTYDELLEESRALANRLARPIIAIYNPTQGIVRDVINATRSLDEELVRPDRECVKLISEVLRIMLTTPNSYQGTRQICAHSEGTILLRYALQGLHRSSYVHLSDSGFQALIDQHFSIQLYGSPIKGAVTPLAEDRNIPGDAVAAAGRHLDRTNGDVISTPNKIDAARSLPAPGLDAHKMREHTARLPQFEAESMLQKAAGDGRKAARGFVVRIKDGTLRHEIAAAVLEEILFKLSEPGMEKMRATFSRELVLLWSDGWVGGFQVPDSLQTVIKNT